MGRMKEIFTAHREEEAIKKQYIDDEYWYEHFKITKHGTKRTTEGQ